MESAHAQMRRLVLQVSALSLDGYVAEDAEADRLFSAADEVRDEWMVSRLRTAGVHIMGSTTYRSMAAYWPTATEVFAEPMNSIPKVVFSRSLQEATWGDSTIASGDTADELRKLKAQPGGDIVAHGGIAFDQSLARLAIVDEYRLVVFPYVAAEGHALFERGSGPRDLELVSATAFPSGSIGLEYRPLRV